MLLSAAYRAGAHLARRAAQPMRARVAAALPSSLGAQPSVRSAPEQQSAGAPWSVVAGGTLAAGAALLSTSAALCHGAHSSTDDARLAGLEAQVAQLAEKLAQLGASQYTGQGDAVFSWDQGLTQCFPEAGKPFEKDFHGGFNEDDATGIVYTGIPGYGLCSISPDLKTWTKIGSDERLKGNIHGLVVFKHNGETQIAMAQNEDARILIVGLDGTVKQQLDMPVGGEFNFGEANLYYSHRPVKNVPWGQPHVPAFACTDVTFLDGRLFVVTGYCDGDFVLTASEKDGKWGWGPLAWGGKGDAPGRFQTAHGIFAYDNHIFVANREKHEVMEFTKEGELVRCLPDIPDSARICNVARTDDYFVMNALEPIQHTPAKTASIYAHSGERLLSTIQPGELGIPVLKHLHHVWPHYVVDEATGTRHLYLLVMGWSAGKFAVLKHEPEGVPSPHNGWNRTAETI